MQFKKILFIKTFRLQNHKILIQNNFVNKMILKNDILPKF
jgi:hypothetical protein